MKRQYRKEIRKGVLLPAAGSKAISAAGKPNSAQIERVRRICLAMPETIEKLSHGEPTFFRSKRVFAMFANNHHHDGHVAVWLPAAEGVQSELIENDPAKYFRPPYVGVKGWVGIELAAVSDDELGFHISEAYRLIAPREKRRIR
jgi:hypothetical protein